MQLWASVGLSRVGEKARKGMEKPINVKLTAGKTRLER
jgi:hypothetical protein